MIIWIRDPLLLHKKCVRKRISIFLVVRQQPQLWREISYLRRKKIFVFDSLCYTFEKKILGGWGLLALQFTNVTRRGFQRYHWVMFYCFSIFFYRWVRMKKCRLFHSLFHCCQNFEMIYYLLFISNLEKRNISLFAPGNYECLCNEQVVQHIILIWIREKTVPVSINEAYCRISIKFCKK